MGTEFVVVAGKWFPLGAFPVLKEEYMKAVNVLPTDHRDPLSCKGSAQIDLMHVCDVTPVDRTRAERLFKYYITKWRFSMEVVERRLQPFELRTRAIYSIPFRVSSQLIFVGLEKGQRGLVHGVACSPECVFGE